MSLYQEASSQNQTHHFIGPYHHILQIIKSSPMQSHQHSNQVSQPISQQPSQENYQHQNNKVLSHQQTKSSLTECLKCENCEQLSKRIQCMMVKYQKLRVQTFASDLTINLLKQKNKELLFKLEEKQHQSSSQIEQRSDRETSILDSIDCCETFNEQKIYQEMIDTFNPQQLKRFLDPRSKGDKQNLIVSQTKKRQFNLKEFKLKANKNIKKSILGVRKYNKISLEPAFRKQESLNHPESSEESFKIYET